MLFDADLALFHRRHPLAASGLLHSDVHIVKGDYTRERALLLDHPQDRATLGARQGRKMG